MYTADAWLSTVEGLQVPAIPFDEVGGNVGTALPAQITSEVPKLNVGVTLGFTVRVNELPTVH